ncbi:MAG: DNA-3-methyladenine glycosylase I [Candidatus Saccharimonadales bacterium]
MKARCQWANASELYALYHDNDWGVPLHKDNELFGYLILEGAQAGLSWQTILNRRENYRQAFANFDPIKVAAFSAKQIEALQNNPGIIRNKLKIRSAVTNAQKFLEIQKEFGSYNNYQWQFVNNKPIQNHWKELSEIPAVSPEATAYSKDLIKRGFKFVGPLIIYAHMQATGMVNDHLLSCFRHKEVAKLS